MKTILIMINLLWLTGCVEQTKNRVRTLLGSEPPRVEESPATYKPEPPPSVDQDKTIQVSPKERVLSLFEQFNRSPDEALANLVFEEFSAKKNLFPANRDMALITELNRSVSHVQQGHRLTLRLLFQLLPILTGENKEHLRGVLARGLDSAPAIVSDYLSRSSEDKSCQLALIVPPGVTPESKRDFLNERLNGLIALRSDTGLNTGARLYADECVRAIQLALNITETSAPVNDSTPAVTVPDAVAP